MLARALFGKDNRWGKLPYTIYPASFVADAKLADYSMATYPGRTYKYFEGKPLWPFGFGLSLTNFSLN
eukprot:m.162985 g.162985  ORF g.162985 m.162985 type:complete len:68 (+) comp14615_c0_seq8:4608-4811(+)